VILGVHYSQGRLYIYHQGYKYPLADYRSLSYLFSVTCFALPQLLPSSTARKPAVTRPSSFFAVWTAVATASTAPPNAFAH